MRISWIVCVVFLFFCSLSFSYGQDITIKGTIQGKVEIAKDEDEEQYLISLSAFNISEQNMDSLVYEFAITKQDSRGNRSSNNQSGMFSIDVQEEKVLAQQGLTVPAGSMLTITCQFLKADTKIFTDTLIRIFPKKVETPSIKGQNKTPRYGQVGPKQEKDPIMLSLSGGFVLDETRSRAGRDLYDEFYSQWLALDIAGDFTIRFEELPFRGRNTIIKIYLNEELLIERFLQPNYEFIEWFAGALIPFLQGKIQELDQIKDDLDNDLIGTEIETY